MATRDRLSACQVCANFICSLIFVHFREFEQKLMEIGEKMHNCINFRANARTPARNLVATP